MEYRAQDVPTDTKRYPREIRRWQIYRNNNYLGTKHTIRHGSKYAPIYVTDTVFGNDGKPNPQHCIHTPLSESSH